ncbi:site-specific DNA-methyltransferase [Thiolapillus sp.]|uniref:site-specific DNA-methyltransferase n=1 Tax=Thiolapillus sp. TaxID=2017437 RepID=UPI0025E67CE7|nr:site-specific DNA-methyltransferase [Thiolapillus sp.]
MPYLSWLTREEDIRSASQAAYRLLEEVPEYGAGDPNSENMLIQGDNLEALKALLPYYAGKVKCIYIDPPYNTKSAFEHYDDNLEHTTWLSMMVPRLELLRELLAEDGSIWVSIDDNEGHYLKVIMDEVFGRGNFVISIAWQKRTSPDVRSAISEGHESLLVFSKELESFKQSANKIPKSAEQIKKFKNPDNDPRGPWVSSDYTAQGYRPNQMYEITTPRGKKYIPPEGVCWKNVEDVFLKLVADNRIWFGKDGKSMPRRKTFLSEANCQTPWSWWSNAEVGHTQESKKEVKAIFGSKNVFDTPKPERLIQRVLQIATNEGDLVLDSFLGSGTTVAVAHKMNRRYIGIELGEHAITHCVPRLQKVIEGEQGGISKMVEWQGGGGFRFYQLGEPIFDADGTINPAIRFPALAAHVWFSETGHAYSGKADQPFLGIHDGTAYALLYNGILGDRKVNGGNVLTHALLDKLQTQSGGHDGPWVIYGEWTPLSDETLRTQKVLFKQTPYDIRAR